MVAMRVSRPSEEGSDLILILNMNFISSFAPHTKQFPRMEMTPPLRLQRKPAAKISLCSPFDTL